MNNYYLYCIILKGCPYSQLASDLLNNNNIKQTKMNIINRDEMDKYKTEKINTFPQIYLKKKNSKGSLLIGGYTELKSIFDKFYKNTLNKSQIKEFYDKNKWSKKSTLRLIELINN